MLVIFHSKGILCVSYRYRIGRIDDGSLREISRSRRWWRWFMGCSSLQRDPQNPARGKKPSILRDIGRYIAPYPTSLFPRPDNFAMHAISTILRENELELKAELCPSVLIWTMYVKGDQKYNIRINISDVKRCENWEHNFDDFKRDECDGK